MARRRSSSSTAWPTTWRPGASRWTTSWPPATGCCDSTTAGSGPAPSPPGPYSSRMLADDAKALVDSLGITDFHLMGVSMGGMIAQEYALAYARTCARSPSAARMRRRVRSARGCSPCGPTWPPCSAFRSSCGTSRCGPSPSPFFEQRGEELAEFETAMRYLDQPVHAYLAQLAVIQQHDTTSRLTRSPRPPWSWPERRTSSSRSRCPGGCTRRFPDRSGPPPRAATPASGSTRPSSTRHS